MSRPSYVLNKEKQRGKRRWGVKKISWGQELTADRQRQGQQKRKRMSGESGRGVREGAQGDCACRPFH